MLTVIIPCYNEEHVIENCFQSLLNQKTSFSWQIIVVLNGCYDNTFLIVSKYKKIFCERDILFSIIEIDSKGKTLALNHADSFVPSGIRVYLDADIIISPYVLFHIKELFDQNPRVQFCVPTIKIGYANSQISRLYGEVWHQLPYVRSGKVCCGFYAVSHEGRKQWDSFPNIIADDKFVRSHFLDDEVQVLKTSSFTIQLPEGFVELVKVRGRWCRGNEQLKIMYPHLDSLNRVRHEKLIKFFITRYDLWKNIPVFLLVYISAKFFAFISRNKETTHWERANNARLIQKRNKY